MSQKPFGSFVHDADTGRDWCFLMAASARSEVSAQESGLLSAACPLCSDSRVRRLQSIACSDIIDIYGESLSGVIRAELLGVDHLDFMQCSACDLRFFWPLVPGSGRLYDVLQSSELYYQSDKPEFGFARTKISDKDDVLEVGCGAGAFGASINSRTYTGLELTPSAAARARMLGLRVLEDKIETHSLQYPARYDIVCAFQVLEHISEVHSFISSCLVTLRPGGRLIFSIPSADSFAGDLPNHALDLPPHHMTRWSDRCLSALTSIFPVSIEEIWNEPLRPVHYRMFLQARFYGTYSRLMGRQPLPVDMSSIGRLALSLGWKLSKTLSFAVRQFPRRGISVTVVLKRSK